MGDSPLFGPGKSELTTASGEFVCPAERKRTTYEVRRTRRRVAVLGVALPIGRGEMIRCTSCGAIFEPASLAGQLSGPEQPVQPGSQPAPAASTSPPGFVASEVASPRPGIAPPPPGMAPRMIAPDALANGPRRVAPPPSAGPSATPPPSTPTSAAAAPPTAAPPTAQAPAASPSPSADRPRQVEPPPWTAQPDAPAAQQPPASSINDKTRITTRSPRREVRWQLVCDDRVVIEIDGSIVVGRDPSSSLVADSTAVPIADDGRSMSKSHASLSVTDEGLFVEDLHSTNGVRIIRGGKEIEVSAGSPAPMRADDVLVLGEREFGIEASV